MLSLKYIAMLLQKNPNIQGAEGSEYRLFTVALMLGNNNDAIRIIHARMLMQSIYSKQIP